jgi:glycosyltransferase involved in cell wall biosynthesis
MNIVMLTNTYLPHVGGVARSVSAFAAEYRRRKHSVLVVAPEFDASSFDEIDVVRIPAIQHFNGSDFSAPLPVSGLLTAKLDAFRPDIVHAHHPFLLGMTALRIARYRRLPLVFTHHTLYERYTHYIPADSALFRRFVVELATHYANLCDHVFAPSESIASLLTERGVEKPITVVPTGVDPGVFAQGDGAAVRGAQGIPADAFVVGHLGRLAPEKNLEFLALAVARFLTLQPRAHFLLAGGGPSEAMVRSVFDAAGLTERLHYAGVLKGRALADTYCAMDVFAFTSKSETQGMVLTEAMAAGVPVVGLDAPGVREVIRNGHNGLLLRDETPEGFCAALQGMFTAPEEKALQFRQGALATAERLSIARTADTALADYRTLCDASWVADRRAHERWEETRRLIKTEWDILKNTAASAAAAFEAPEGQDGALE